MIDASAGASVRSADMARALKVFRTPIGFHDAYVAATSQKAALEAWGADANLFARGAAELVTDPALMKDALAEPGKVIKRPRASADEHFASLAEQKGSSQAPSTSPRKASKAKPPRRPSRAALKAAEDALEQQRDDGRGQLSVLEQERDRITAQIDRLRGQLQETAGRLEERVERERRKYEAALNRWRAF